MSHETAQLLQLPNRPTRLVRVRLPLSPRPDQRLARAPDWLAREFAFPFGRLVIILQAKANAESAKATVFDRSDCVTTWRK